MSLTLGERTHWKERIARRIDQRIEGLVTRQDPTLLERVRKEARLRAYDSLGILRQHLSLEAQEKQIKEIDKRKRELRAEQRAALKGITVEEELAGFTSPYDKTVEEAVAKRAEAHEVELLAADDVGKQVLALRAEKENLLDTVWLATSSSQIKELWEQVNALLEVTPTELESKALAISPPQDE